MIDIIISLVVYVLLALCAVYVFKEIFRRKNLKQNNSFVETNWHIGGSFGAWILSVVFVVGFTIGYYIQKDESPLYLHIIISLIESLLLIIAFLLAFNKIIINKATGDIVAYGILKKKKFNVKEITLIKHTSELWKVYADNKKLFSVGYRYHNSPSEFYIYIRKESGCKEKHLKGHTGRSI